MPVDVLTGCNAHMSNNLTIVEGALSSRVLENVDKDLLLAVEDEPVVYNSHNLCVRTSLFKKDTGIFTKGEKSNFKNLTLKI